MTRRFLFLAIYAWFSVACWPQPASPAPQATSSQQATSGATTGVQTQNGNANGPEIDLPLQPKSVRFAVIGDSGTGDRAQYDVRSEEHTSELQSQSNLVCRLLLEKKKQQTHH